MARWQYFHSNANHSNLQTILSRFFSILFLLTSTFIILVGLSLLTAVIYDWIGHTSYCISIHSDNLKHCAMIGFLELFFTLVHLAFAMITIWPLLSLPLFFIKRDRYSYFVNSIILSAIIAIPFLFSVPILGVLLGKIITNDENCNLSAWNKIYNLECMTNGMVIQLAIWIFYSIIFCSYGLYSFIHSKYILNSKLKSYMNYEIIA